MVAVGLPQLLESGQLSLIGRDRSAEVDTPRDPILQGSLKVFPRLDPIKNSLCYPTPCSGPGEVVGKLLRRLPPRLNLTGPLKEVAVSGQAVTCPKAEQALVVRSVSPGLPAGQGNRQAGPRTVKAWRSSSRLRT